MLVLGLPRGGVLVACEVAAALGAPVDVLIVRKLGAPHNPEPAVGAVAFGGVTVYNDELLETLNLTEQDLESTRRRELDELTRRLRPRRIIVAAPRAAIDSAERLEKVADQLVVLQYYAVGAWYEQFPQLRDEEVVECLAAAAKRKAAAGHKSAHEKAPR